MRIRQYKVFSFDELNDCAKEKAISEYYEQYEYPFLYDDLLVKCCELLDENGIQYNNNRLGICYSLSHCQGDGLCVVGEFEYLSVANHDKKSVCVSHDGPNSNQYCHLNTVRYRFEDNKGNEIDCDWGFVDIYRNICKKLVIFGYEIVDYRMGFDEFASLSDANDYMYLQDGTID